LLDRNTADVVCIDRCCSSYRAAWLLCSMSWGRDDSCRRCVGTCRRKWQSAEGGVDIHGRDAWNCNNTKGTTSCIMYGLWSCDPQWMFKNVHMMIISQTRWSRLWWSGVVVAHWSQSMKSTYVGPGYCWDGWPCPGSVPLVGHLFLYVTSHPGQVNSLAIPS